jgi:hypothetical protein
LKETVCVDFDGVIVKHDWRGVDYFAEILPGAKDFLENLSKKYEVVIFTCRCTESINGIEKKNLLVNRVRQFLEDNELPYDRIWAEQGKPIAKAYIDDRGISCRPEDDSMAYEKTLLMIDNM